VLGPVLQVTLVLGRAIINSGEGSSPDTEIGIGPSVTTLPRDSRVGIVDIGFDSYSTGRRDGSSDEDNNSERKLNPLRMINKMATETRVIPRIKTAFLDKLLTPIPIIDRLFSDLQVI
jgi:hypothetical protein